MSIAPRGVTQINEVSFPTLYILVKKKKIATDLKEDGFLV